MKNLSVIVLLLFARVAHAESYGECVVISDHSRSKSRGSGQLICPAGHIASCAHGMSRKNEVIFASSDYREPYDAELIAADPVLDLSLLKIDLDRPMPYREVFLEEPRPGDELLHFGFSSNRFRRGRIFTGVIFDFGRKTSWSAIAIPGDSGGPVVNEHGRLVSVVTSTDFKTRTTGPHPRHMKQFLVNHGCHNCVPQIIEESPSRQQRSNAVPAGVSPQNRQQETTESRALTADDVQSIIGRALDDFKNTPPPAEPLSRDEVQRMIDNSIAAIPPAPPQPVVVQALTRDEVKGMIDEAIKELPKPEAKPPAPKPEIKREVPTIRVITEDGEVLVTSKQNGEFIDIPVKRFSLFGRE